MVYSITVHLRFHKKEKWSPIVFLHASSHSLPSFPSTLTARSIYGPRRLCRTEEEKLQMFLIDSKTKKTSVKQTKKKPWLSASAYLALYLQHLLSLSIFFYHAVSCWKLIIMQIIFAYRNVNWLCLVECNWVLSHFLKSLFVISFQHSLSACESVGFWIFLWIASDIFLVPSWLTELKNVFDMCSFCICETVMLICYWKIIFQ